MKLERAFNKKVIFLILTTISVFYLTACQSFSSNNYIDDSDSMKENGHTDSYGNIHILSRHEESADEDLVMQKIDIIIGNSKFSAELYDNESAEVFVSMLPVTLTMNELNENEKYHYLSESIPTDAIKPSLIHEGDLMMFGSDCLVLFYKSFHTNYNYTPLGHINDVSDLENAVGNGNVTVTFQQTEKN